MLYDTIPLNHSDTSSLYQSYSRLRRHPDRGWLYSLTRDQQYRRAVHAAHHSHLLGTNLWVQMTIPLQTREEQEGRLTRLPRASTRTLAGQTTPIPTTPLPVWAWSRPRCRTESHSWRLPPATARLPTHMAGPVACLDSLRSLNSRTPLLSGSRERVQATLKQATPSTRNASRRGATYRPDWLAASKPTP